MNQKQNVNVKIKKKKNSKIKENNDICIEEAYKTTTDAT